MNYLKIKQQHNQHSTSIAKVHKKPPFDFEQQEI